MLQAALDALKPEQDFVEPQPEAPPRRRLARRDRGAARSAAVAQYVAAHAAVRLHHAPQARARASDGMLNDPAGADGGLVAGGGAGLASILADGVSIRLTGEDVERGTFSHRHAVFHDVNTGRARAASEAAAGERGLRDPQQPAHRERADRLRHGYNIQEPSRLVIWEAHGDFINGAQVMIDEFVVSARGKWGQRPSLVPAAAARARRTGPGPCRRQAGALPATRRRPEHARGQLHDGGPAFPPAAPAARC